MSPAQRIPILKVGRVLVVPIQTDMDDHTVVHLQERILSELERTRARGVLIDISLLEMVDSFIGRMLSDIAAMARVMDARTVLDVDEGIKLLREEFGIEEESCDDDELGGGLGPRGEHVHRA